MIVSASYKTDIPAFYGDWFMTRLAAGWAGQVNPYSGKTHRVALDPDSVDGFVFWTRNLGPFLDRLGEVRARGYPFVVQYTVTGYLRALDFATIAPDRAVAHFRALLETFGPGVAVWRYDPVALTSLTPPEWHLDTFARLAAALAGLTDEVTVSFMQAYRKTARNMDAAARAFGFSWWDPPDDEKRDLLARLAEVATGNGLALTLCGQRDLLVPGAADARCIDAERLARVAGRAVTVPHRAHRTGCGCWASRDIGDYDTCPHGCAYCYAVRNRTLAKRRFAAHDPENPFLVRASR